MKRKIHSLMLDREWHLQNNSTKDYNSVTVLGFNCSCNCILSNLFFQDGEIRLVEGQVEELTSKTAIEKSYKIYLMGMYIKIEIFHGMTFIWDMKTTVIIQVTPSFQVL